MNCFFYCIECIHFDILGFSIGFLMGFSEWIFLSGFSQKKKKKTLSLGFSSANPDFKILIRLPIGDN